MYVDQQKKDQKQNAYKQQVENGMNDAEQQKAAASDTRRQYKQFLNELFKFPINSVIFEGQRVFRTKEIMQLYHQRVAEPIEWENNVQLLSKIQNKYYKRIVEPQPKSSHIAVVAVDLALTISNIEINLLPQPISASLISIDDDDDNDDDEDDDEASTNPELGLLVTSDGTDADLAQLESQDEIASIELLSVSVLSVKNISIENIIA